VPLAAKAPAHGEDDEAEREGDADVGDATAGGIVDDDRAGAGEDEGEGADGFGEEFSHHIRQSVCNMGLVIAYVNAYMFAMRDLTVICAALSDETRLRLLYLMKDGEVCVCHLQDVLGTNQPKVSRHLAYLKRAGLVEARRDGRWMHYQLKPQKGARREILAMVLRQWRNDPRMKADAKKLGGIVCCG
jgi:ArsR family transcriptional regulator, arsenate/arsenite/antimonite-responsive transcriptional repressor